MLLWIAIATFGVGLVLFVVGMFLPKGFGVAGEFDWGKWLREQFKNTLGVVRDRSLPKADRINAAGLLLMLWNVSEFIVGTSTVVGAIYTAVSAGTCNTAFRDAGEEVAATPERPRVLAWANVCCTWWLIPCQGCRVQGRADPGRPRGRRRG